MVSRLEASTLDRAVTLVASGSGREQGALHATIDSMKLQIASNSICCHLKDIIGIPTAKSCSVLVKVPVRRGGFVC